MADQTTVLGIPFPEIADTPPNIETAVKPLAERVEAILVPAGLASGDGLKWNGTGWVRESFATAAAVAAKITHGTVTPAAGTADRIFYNSAEDKTYFDTGSAMVEIGGGGSMVSAYLESDAGAGVTTGQTDPGTSYQDLCDLDGTATEVPVPEDGSYKVEIQGGGSNSSTGAEAVARAYRVGDSATLMRQFWADLQASTYDGSGASSPALFGASSSAADATAQKATRDVQLAEGDVIRLQFKVSSGTLNLNRDSCHVRLTKVADSGGGTPT